MRRAVLLLVLTAVSAGCDEDREPVADPVQPTTSMPSVPGTTGADQEVDGWCIAATEMRDATLAMDTVDPTDPSAVEKALTGLIATAEEAAAVAPSEIAADVESVLGLMRRLDAALAEADYDFLRADPTGVVAEGGADEATARIDAFNAERCRFDPVEPEDAAAAPVDRAELREQAIEIFVNQGFTRDESACLFDNMDLDDPNLVDDEDAMLELIQVCDLDLERLSRVLGAG